MIWCEEQRRKTIVQCSRCSFSFGSQFDSISRVSYICVHVYIDTRSCIVNRILNISNIHSNTARDCQMLLDFHKNPLIFNTYDQNMNIWQSFLRAYFSLFKSNQTKPNNSHFYLSYDVVWNSFTLCFVAQFLIFFIIKKIIHYACYDIIILQCVMFIAIALVHHRMPSFSF